MQTSTTKAAISINLNEDNQGISASENGEKKVMRTPIFNVMSVRKKYDLLKGATMNVQATTSVGRASEEIQWVIRESSLGSVLVARSNKGICAVLLGSDLHALERDLQHRFPSATLVNGDSQLEKLAAQVVTFVEDPSRDLDVPLDVRGTDFQQRVWKALREIPVGLTASYSDVANKIGLPKSVRAVAQACAANALAVVIPCHRVVKRDGALSGYRWGVERRQILLDREAAI
jgi:AraC family transcriptional regulator of adaptative response/methylated-DNA-[protein]-cysteine methyltransferase